MQGITINEASDERAEMHNNQATTIYHYEAIRSQEIERKQSGFGDGKTITNGDHGDSKRVKSPLSMEAERDI